MLCAVTSEEVKDKDIIGKYLTPYGFVNSAPDGTSAAGNKLAKALWTESVEACWRSVPGIEILQWILSPARNSPSAERDHRIPMRRPMVSVDRWPIASRLASYIIPGWLHYRQLACSIESSGESG